MDGLRSQAYDGQLLSHREKVSVLSELEKNGVIMSILNAGLQCDCQ